MQITGTRPVKVTALPTTIRPAGVMLPDPVPPDYIKSASPSLIQMDNGGIVRNMMGGMTGDSHMRRLWGKYASVDLTDGVKIRVGASGHGRQYKVDAKWSALGELAEKTGHWGGDFWEIYFFAREILTGEKAPWDVYASSDVTLAGIMALKSTQSGHVEEIPDFRIKEVRDRYRDDNFRQQFPFDTKCVFPEDHDEKITSRFTSVMVRMGHFMQSYGAILVREVFDGLKLEKDFSDSEERAKLVQDVRQLIRDLPSIAKTYREARMIHDAYPDCPAGRALESLLAASYEEKVIDTDRTIAGLRDWLARFGVGNPVFTNPVSAVEGDHPFIVFSNDWRDYYSPTAKDTWIKLRRTPRIEHMADWGLYVPVYEAGPKSPVAGDIRAPKISQGDEDRWFIYASGRVEGKGNRLFVLPSKTNNPFDGFNAPVVLDDELDAIDPTVFKLADGKSVLACSKAGKIVLREMTASDALGVRSVELPVRGTAPACLRHGTRTFLAYTAENSTIGFLELIGDDSFATDSWKQIARPLLIPANGIEKIRNASFFLSPDGTETWCLFEASDKFDLDNEPGAIRFRVQKLEFDGDDLPVAAETLGGNAELRSPSGEA